VYFARLGKALPAIPSDWFPARTGGEISAAWAKINSRLSNFFRGQKIVEREKPSLARANLTIFEAGPTGFLGNGIRPAQSCETI